MRHKIEKENTKWFTTIYEGKRILIVIGYMTEEEARSKLHQAYEMAGKIKNSMGL